MGSFGVRFELFGVVVGFWFWVFFHFCFNSELPQAAAAAAA